MPNLNICLHNIVANPSEIKNIYDLTTDQLEKVFSLCEQACLDLSLDYVNYYFDDGYVSFKTQIAQKSWNIPRHRLIVAVVTESIGSDSKLSDKDIRRLYNDGFGIVPHGVSHAALAVFDETDKLLGTPTDTSTYRNSIYGKSIALNSSEVLFQLTESRKQLKSVEPMVSFSEFVLPYGLYNEQTILIARQAEYERLLTCHSGIDNGQFLAPRHLITQNNISTLESDLRNLSTSFKTLI